MKEDNLEKLHQIFDTILQLDDSINLNKLDQANHKKWDSLAQVLLIAAIESEFHISIEVSEYENFISYNAIKTLLQDFQL
jgi:acyl carrier protein